MTRRTHSIGIGAAAMTLASLVTGCWMAQQPAKQKQQRPDPIDGQSEDIGDGYVAVTSNRRLAAVDIQRGNDETLVEPYRDNSEGISHSIIGTHGRLIYLSRSDQQQNDLDILVLERDGTIKYFSQTPTIREDALGITDDGHIVYATLPARRILKLNPDSREITDVFPDSTNPAVRSAAISDARRGIVVTHEGNMHTVDGLDTATGAGRELFRIDDQITPFNGFGLVNDRFISYKGSNDPNATELVIHRRSSGADFIFEVPDSTLDYTAVSAAEIPNSTLISAIVQEAGPVRKLLDVDFSRSAITSSYRPINFTAFPDWVPRAAQNASNLDAILDKGGALVGILGDDPQGVVPEILFYDRTTRTVSDLISPLVPLGADNIGIGVTSYNGNALIQIEAHYSGQPNANKVVTYDGTQVLDIFSNYDESKVQAKSTDGRYVIVTAANHQVTSRQEDVYLIDLEQLPQTSGDLNGRLLVSETGKTFEQATFSKDGEKVVYSFHDATAQQTEVYVHNRTTGEHERVYRSGERLEVTKWRGDYMLVDTVAGPDDFLLDLSRRDNQGHAKATVISHD